MVRDNFGVLLEELGAILKISLTPDKHNNCFIKYPDGFNVIIELDPSHERLQILSDLGTPPPGRYLENILREALKANGLPPQYTGIFAFSKKKESLVLYATLALQEINSQKLAEFLDKFKQKADLWRESITRGEIPSYLSNELSFGKSGGMGMFGLR